MGGPAEETLPKVLSDYHDNEKFEVSAILDPPRNGIHRKLITCVRACKPINTLIYMSCDPNADRVHQNFVDLTKQKSKTVLGEAFTLESVTPVDMFPHTNLAEVVFV